MPLTIRPAAQEDAGAIWQALSPVIEAGDTYALPRDWTHEQALAYWLAPEKQSFVAELDGHIAGTYYLRVNQAGGGSHVANCGYITAGWAAGRGVARAMCAHSLEAAWAAGFRAMQFNLVVGTNLRAIRLWQSMGFAIIGRLPDAFEHPQQGFVEALVMYRQL
jgi:ribosomal protein S18 acetylase RimI-like enzyme